VGCNNTPVEGLRALVVHNPKLRHLELNGFSASLGDKFLELLTANCGESLEYLCLRPSTDLRDAGLASIARACPHLRHLDLTPPDYTSKISATALLDPARRLYLSRRHCVSPAVVLQLVTLLPHLRHLEITRGTPPSVAQLREVLKINRNFRALHLSDP
jgi:hypothetical protein